MGARGVVPSIRMLAVTQDQERLAKITDLVLAAPDLPQKVMDRDLLPVLKSWKHLRTTLYVSNHDLAEWVSEKWNGTPPAGAGAEDVMYIRKCIETIDIGDRDETSLGHSALFSSRDVAADLWQLLGKGGSAENRFGLGVIKAERGRYWRMR